VRNALTLLVVVALLILAVGALNNGTAFDVDYVAGTISAVSLFWVSAVIAALVLVVGLAAAWFAQSAVAGTRRKLEAELQSTYERLREAEAQAARPAQAAAEAAVVTPAAEPVAVTASDAEVSGEDASDVAGEAATVVAQEDATVVAGEDETVIVGEAATVVAEEPETVVAPGVGVGGEPGEATAVTMTGTPPDAGETAADAVADEVAGADEPADDGRGSSGS
jgi:uncharacterized membrane protein YciS (DUF1049 family)